MIEVWLSSLAGYFIDTRQHSVSPFTVQDSWYRVSVGKVQDYTLGLSD